MAGTGGGTVTEVKSTAELDNAIGECNLVIVHFWAAWCDASKHMDQVFSRLSTDFPLARFLRVEAEEQPEISEAYSVPVVPYFVFLKDGKVVDTLEGADQCILANKVAKVARSIKPGEPAAPASLGRERGAPQNSSQLAPDLYDRLKTQLQHLLNSHPIMLFMKGTPRFPKCGSSKKMVEVLRKEDVEFGSFDILKDNEVRERLKKFSNWPTFPQLYYKGYFFGGCDIVFDLHDSGEFMQGLMDADVLIGDSDDGSEFAEPEPHTVEEGISEPSSGLIGNTSDRLWALINSAPVMFFMKGRPDDPQCGFSRKVVDILRQEKVRFESFDILKDDKVRQRLKASSNWSSYPQLFIKGNLVGGSDIVLEMHKSGELKKILAEKGVPFVGTIEDRLRQLVNMSRVMLFMKGRPDSPECGFSSKVVNALKEVDVEFGSFDILSDEDVRQGLKTFSNWPTFPQLYYKGKLIGGCDIVMAMRDRGELKDALSE